MVMAMNGQKVLFDMAGAAGIRSLMDGDLKLVTPEFNEDLVSSSISHFFLIPNKMAFMKFLGMENQPQAELFMEYTCGVAGRAIYRILVGETALTADVPLEQAKMTAGSMMIRQVVGTMMIQQAS